jgi:glycosyl transferase family 11
VITVSLIGGLGNQMFQYAAGKALAERHGVPLALDLSGFRAVELRNTPRSFLLDRLRVPEAASFVPEEPEKPNQENFARARWKARIDRLLGKAGLPKFRQSRNEYREPHFHYDPVFEGLGPRTAIFGYFQSERYFSSIAGGLLDWFSPRQPLSEGATAALARIQASRLPVSVHVRRGDYLKPGTMEVHGILGGPYYQAAINRIESALGSEVDYFVFSDDAAAAEQVLDFLPKSRFNHVRGDPKHPWEDMTLMSRCRHHVIANSSFSWWGAWLNSSPEKIVIAPRAWFTQTGLRLRDTCDLYPPDWVQL